MSLIEAKDSTRHFGVLNRREGLMGAVRDLFSGDYRTARAVDGVSFDIYLSPLQASASSHWPISSGTRA